MRDMVGRRMDYYHCRWGVDPEGSRTLDETPDWSLLWVFGGIFRPLFGIYGLLRWCGKFIRKEQESMQSRAMVNIVAQKQWRFGFNFSSYIFVVAVPSVPLTNAQAWHKDYKGSITTGETAFAFISLVIGVLCAGFSNSIFTYRHSIIKVNAADSGLPTANTSHRSIT